MPLQPAIWKLCFAAVSTIGSALLLTWTFKRWKALRSRDIEEQEDVALFFPCCSAAPCRSVYDSEPCFHRNCRFDHSPSHPLVVIVHKIRSAKVSLDVAMYTFSFPTLKDEIVQALRRGVRVRLLIDYEQLNGGGCTVSTLLREGVELRQGSREFFMHHKFAIVDGKCLINGSLNWTRAGAMGNCENVIIMHRPHLVGEFLTEFESLWRKFDPEKVACESYA